MPAFPVTFRFTNKQAFCAWSGSTYWGIPIGYGGSRAIVLPPHLGRTDDDQLKVTVPPSGASDASFLVGGILVESSQAVDTQPVGALRPISEAACSLASGRVASLQSQSSDTQIGQVEWTWTGPPSNAVGIVLEIKIDDTYASLAQSYEPILNLAMGDYLPTAPENFWNAASTWRVDDSVYSSSNSYWSGDVNAHFPRKPTPLGNPSTKDDFLEFGGWLQRDGMTHLIDVPAANSENVYADEGKILSNWHAISGDGATVSYEVFDKARLLKLSQGVTAPDLVKYISNSAEFTDPLLLCYYFFYPYHKEGVASASCTSVQAAWVSSHAGDWPCMAILFDTKPGETMQPTHIGLTGLAGPNDVGDPSGRREPDGDEGDLLAGRLRPRHALVGQHPVLHVAKGSHGMYWTPGVQDVVPTAASSFCGAFDDARPTYNTVPPGPRYDPATAPSPVFVILVKVLGTGFIGSLLGASGRACGRGGWWFHRVCGGRSRRRAGGSR